INPYYFIDRRILNYERIINQSEIHELQPILDWLIERKNDAYSERASILHRDFHPHNILVTKEGEAFVIDWAACTIGDYREDLGWSLLLTHAYTNKEIRNKILELYEKEKGSEVKNIEYFEILAILRRFSDILNIFKFGAKTAGMRDEATQQIKETIFHMRRIYELLEEKTGIKITELERFIQNLDKK
ncbi:MAG: phosphotransferase family protein, partial [Candidatus Thorarchaeota archaeon]